MPRFQRVYKQVAKTGEEFRQSVLEERERLQPGARIVIHNSILSRGLGGRPICVEVATAQLEVDWAAQTFAWRVEGITPDDGYYYWKQGVDGGFWEPA